MRVELASALIGVGGAVAGTLITVYSDELKAIFMGRLKRNRDLLGDWDCTWTVDLPERAPPYQDIVTINKVSGEAIRGVAYTRDVGPYRLSGRASESSRVTLFYEGLEGRRPLGGVIILELNAVRDEMRELWLEHHREGGLIGGATQWKHRAH